MQRFLLQPHILRLCHKGRAIAACVAAALLAIVFPACRRAQLTPDNTYIFGDWEVKSILQNNPDADSAWIICNPVSLGIGEVSYNGLYSDQYVENDSVKATVIYDSVQGYFMSLVRMVTINSNPDSLWLTAKIPEKAPLHTSLIRTDTLQSLFKVADREAFDSLMLSGDRVCMIATTPPALAAANADRQAYSFCISTAGFRSARTKAYLLSKCPSGFNKK